VADQSPSQRRAGTLSMSLIFLRKGMLGPVDTRAPKSRDEFASCLRELRIQAGAPSFRQLAKITHYSSSTLADATSGRRLPTEPVLKALVTACGDDPVPWLEHLRRIAASEQHGRPDASSDRDSPDPEGGRAANGQMVLPAGAVRRFFWHRPLSFLVVGGLAVLAVGLAMGWLGASAASAPRPAVAGGGMELPGVPPFSGTLAPAPSGRVPDGTDPVAGHCKADSQLVGHAPVMLNGVEIGELDLRYSSWCGAGWAELYLYLGEPAMMGEVTVRSGDDRFSAIANPLIDQVHDYTDVIVPGPGGCLGAGGAVYEAGRPVVTALIPCKAQTALAS
jgi:hypothetical protein